ncbi:carnosine synthase 1-like [Ruditapes philippinarum]|uniref:carnosine synthase 1-like n=1 Tax=Ruditapes philippinarum TaxID=129788 RepID=UPI00295ABE61|nr:carnosine synthase 1-like [Ruditapes philippinarum]
MEQMAQKHVMKGKHVIVISGGSYRMRTLGPDADSYGIKVTLVEHDSNHLSINGVHCFIEYDYTDHTRDHEHASEIVRLIHERGIKADGCLSFCNECTPLAALICEKMDLRGVTYNAAVIATSKSLTQNVLRRRSKEGDDSNTGIFATHAVHLRSALDCDRLPESFKFPAILKLDNCSAAVGACMVKSQTEMKTKFQKVTSSLRTDSDFPHIGLNLGNSMTAWEFYVGTEHIVDVVIYDKTLICAFVTDSGVVRQPYYIATARRMPTFLPKEQRNQIIDAAFRCCLGIGLTDGLFNAEFMMTANGPKLIEINPRMGGYVFRDWLQKLYGIDIMFYAMMIASGIKPEMPDFSESTIQMGVMVVPSLHSKLLTENHSNDKLRKMIESGDVLYLQFLEKPEKSSPYEKPFGIVAVSSSSSIETKTKLMNVCKTLHIDQKEYQVEQFLKNF